VKPPPCLYGKNYMAVRQEIERRVRPGTPDRCRVKSPPGSFLRGACVENWQAFREST
jgi:hypothetical protein